MSFQLVVVDDQEIDRYLVQRVAQKWGKGASVVGIANPKEALEIFSDAKRLAELCIDASRPIVVLLDINMPEMSGFELLDELEKRLSTHERKSLLFVMMFSSSDNQSDRDRAQSYDTVKDYIVKPLEPTDLDTIAHLLAQARKDLGMTELS